MSISGLDRVTTSGFERRAAPVQLEVTGLRVAYGKAEAVHDVSFDVRQGEFSVMLGRNGAGKSTTLHAICGLIPKSGGKVVFNGQDLTNASPREIVNAGIINVLEGHRVFTTLSVEDNLLLGTYARTRRGDRAKLDRIYGIFPEIAAKRHELAARLSGGQQQILAVGQGMIGEPKLLILDEPSSGLAPLVIDRILQVAADLAAEGMTILLVEQLVEKALKHADNVLLMSNGRVAASVTPAELQSGDLIRQVLIGGDRHDAAH